MIISTDAITFAKRITTNYVNLLAYMAYRFNFSTLTMNNFQYILPKHFLTRLLGKLAYSKIDWLKNALIRLACKHYGIRLDEAEWQRPKDYPHFNAFFTRALQPNARPIDPKPHSIVSPADGKVSEYGTIRAGALLQAKNRFYSLTDFVGDQALSAKFENGQFLTVYLSPKDYHRVHMPMDGTLVRSYYLPGALFAVNQQTTQSIPRVFARNERLVAHFHHANGDFLVVFVGALFVAGIETQWEQSTSLLRPHLDTFTPQSPVHFAKGDEIGRFHFGSTIVLITQKDHAQWHDTLDAIKMGQSIGNQPLTNTAEAT